MIIGDLYRSNRITSGFSEEMKFISHKYEKADDPKLFINSVTRQFQDKSTQCNIDNFDDYNYSTEFFRYTKIFYLNRIAILC